MDYLTKPGDFVTMPKTEYVYNEGNQLTEEDAGSFVFL